MDTTPASSAVAADSDQAIAELLRRFIHTEVFHGLCEAEKLQVEHWLKTLDGVEDIAPDPKSCSVGLDSHSVVVRELCKGGDIYWQKRPCLCLDRTCGEAPYDMYVTVTHGIRFAPEVPVEQKVAEARASIVYEETGEQSSKRCGVVPLFSEPPMFVTKPADRIAEYLSAREPKQQQDVVQS